VTLKAMLRCGRVRYDGIMLDQPLATGTSAGGLGRGGADATDPAISAIRQFLRGRTDVRLAVVFGSRARGRATSASDVDVALRAPGVDLRR
jgi:hypothetical protein